MTIGAGRVSWSGLFSPILKHIREWEPTLACSERECQSQVATFLRELAPDARVEQEYLHNGNRIDLYIAHAGIGGLEDEVFIETKLNLNTESECKRLLGQLALMKQDNHDVIVVLFGETKPECLSRILSVYKQNEGGMLFPQFVIVEKHF